LISIFPEDSVSTDSDEDLAAAADVAAEVRRANHIICDQIGALETFTTDLDTRLLGRRISEG
jgi:hypothetical protein